MRVPQLSNERLFKHYYMGFDFAEIGPKIKDADLKPFWDAFAIALQGYEITYKSGTRKVLIRDTQNATSSVNILIGFGDTNTPDPTLMNIETNRQRVIPKEEQEGQSFGGHGIVLKTMHKDFRYAILLEDVPGITSTLFKQLVKRCAKKGFDDSGILKWTDKESNEEHEKRVTITVEERPSQTLLDILSGNTLLLAELSSSNPAKEILDQSREWVREKVVEQVHLGPGFPKDPKSMFTAVKRLVKISKKRNYDLVKIYVKEAKGKRTSSFILDVENDLDTLDIGMKTTIKFPGEFLAQSPEKLNDKVCQRMVAILK